MKSGFIGQNPYWENRNIRKAFFVNRAKLNQARYDKGVSDENLQNTRSGGHIERVRVVYPQRVQGG
jgi:hypothetical protein